MRPVLLGIDLGTSSAKAVLLDSAGRTLAVARSAYPASPPGEGHDVTTWWTGASRAVNQVLHAPHGPVAAIGLSGQMHTVVLLDAGGDSVRPPIGWADPRPAGTIAELTALAAPYRHRLVNLPAPGLSVAALHWLRRAEPGQFSRVRSVLQPKDWLGARLTGTAVTEPTDGCATGLWDFATNEWHRDFCAAVGLPDGILPPVAPASGSRGGLLAGPAGELGLTPGIPVALGRADVAASLLGAGRRLHAGDRVLTLGTGAQLCALLSRPPSGPIAPALALAGPYDTGHYAMAATYSAGMALDWVRRLFGLDWPALLDQAFSRPAQPDGPLFAPFLGGERLFAGGPGLTGSWLDLRLAHRPEDLIQAAVHGCLYAVRAARDLLDAAVGGSSGELIALGGGVADPRMRQLLADVLATPVWAPDEIDSSARGAAISAAIAAGWTGGLAEAAASCARPMSTCQPEPAAVARHDHRFARFAALLADRQGTAPSG